MQMRTFLLRALVLLLIAISTESVRSDEEVPQVTELPEESHHDAAHAKAAAPGDEKKLHKEESLVQFGTGLGIGDALGMNPPPPPKMPPAVPKMMPLEAEPGETMPPVAHNEPEPTPTPHPTEIWERTPLPDIRPMDTMPIGFIPHDMMGETMPPPVLATEDDDDKPAKKMPPPAETEEDSLLEDTLSTPDSMPKHLEKQLDAARQIRRPRRVAKKKQKVQQSRQLMPPPKGENIWDINMEQDNPQWQPEKTIQKRLVAGMPKVPVHKKQKGTTNKNDQPLMLARKFGRHLQAFFQHIYENAHGVVWGEWSPGWEKYRHGICSILFALTVAILPVLVLLFVTLSRYLSSKLNLRFKQKQADAAAARDFEKGQLMPDPATSDALFYTSRMFPVE